MISALLAIPSPRDIPLAKNEMDRIKGEGIEKLWIKYHNETEAYAIMENWFLNHSKAEYLVICPDDLIVRQKDYDDLVQTISDYGGPEKIPVLAGVCNMHNIAGESTILCICPDTVIHPQRRRRNWVWMDMRTEQWREFTKERLRTVAFSGFACQFIRRDIVEKIGLHGDLRYNEWHRQAQDYSFDVIFCWLCNQQKVPIYINPQVRMLHLRGSDRRQVQGIEPLLLNRAEYPKKVIHVDADGKEEDVTTLAAVTPAAEIRIQ